MGGGGGGGAETNRLHGQIGASVREGLKFSYVTK